MYELSTGLSYEITPTTSTIITSFKITPTSSTSILLYEPLVELMVELSELMIGQMVELSYTKNEASLD